MNKTSENLLETGPGASVAARARWRKQTRTCTCPRPQSPQMAEPTVLLTPKCIECDQIWLPWDTNRWQAYWIDDGLEDVLLFYCAACAKREFGSAASD